MESESASHRGETNPPPPNDEEAKPAPTVSHPKLAHAADSASHSHLPSHLPNGDDQVTYHSPYWTSSSRHARSVSYQSIGGQRPSQILLEDHSEEDHVQAQSCWAESATIDEYVIISGATGIGAYVVWHCTVKTLKGGDIALRKRYSEFDKLRSLLIRAFPHAEAMIPELPRKSMVSRFRPEFLEKRRLGLSHFLNCILLNPEFAASPILKDFIFS